MSKNKANPTPINIALNECRPLFLGMIWFSFFINLLMLAVPIYTMQVLDRVLNSGSQETLIFLTLIVCIALIFMGLLQAMRSFVFSQIARKVDDETSEIVVSAILALSLKKPSLGTQPLRDLSVLKSFISSPALTSLFDAPWAIIYFAVIYMINIQLGIAITIGAVILAILAVINYRVPKEKTDGANEAQIQANQHLDIMLRNAEVVKALGIRDTATQTWRENHKKHNFLSFRASNDTVTISSFTKIFRLSIQMMVTGFGAFLALSGGMSPGSMIAVSILSGKALQPFDAAVSIYQGITGVKQSFRRLQNLFKSVEESGLNLVDQKTKTELPEPLGRITIDKLSYQDKGSGKWLVKNIALTVEPGEIIGVVGPSGAGKTTLSRLLVGVLEPSVGAVRLDGAQLQNWDDKQLSHYLGYLPQDVELFSGTISDNIARLSKEAKDEDIVTAAQLAGVHDFILSLSDGYETNIGPNGIFLSAGQRQRVGLARCFFGNVKFAVLDEPNSNLDSEGENALVDCVLKAKAAGITTFMIAHRPTIMQKVDKLLVIQAGEQKHFGPREEVLQCLTPQAPNVAPISKPQQVKNGLLDQERANTRLVKKMPMSKPMTQNNEVTQPHSISSENVAASSSKEEISS